MVTRNTAALRARSDEDTQHGVDPIHRLTVLSYEFRTPLTGILGYSQLLSDEVKNNEQASKYARHLRRSTHKLHQVLDTVLEHANLEAGHTQNMPEYVRVHELLPSILGPLRLNARRKKLQLKVRCPKEDHAFIDPTLFTSIVNHLVDNAIKFTESGTVQIEIIPKAKSLRLIVSDTGIGIQAESIQHLSTPYWQESQGITRRHRGLGLGLSIVYRIVELIKGDLRIESTPRVGTTVTVDIPMLSHTEEVDLVEFGTLTRILYVEDDPIIQMLARRILKNYDVDVCSTAEEALEKVKSVRYDAMILDIQLGHGMNGHQLCRILRDHPDFQRVPIAAATAMNTDSLARANPNLFSHFLPKPFNRDQMIELIEEMTKSAHHSI